jgi:Flp pilus assembly protein TadB
VANPDKRTDIDKLLAEADRMLAGDSVTPGRAVQPRQGAEPDPGTRVPPLRAAALSGAVAAVAVWLLFALLPFLGATSGAVGAFLGTFVAVLVFRRRR